MMNVKLIQFQEHKDDRGALVATSSLVEIPFEIKRVFYMYEIREGQQRGFHAHKTLQQVLICTRGSCDVLLDNGNEREVVSLCEPNVGLLVPPLVWHEIRNFSYECILMSLASDYFDENDYIRDYQDFMTWVLNKQQVVYR